MEAGFRLFQSISPDFRNHNSNSKTNNNNQSIRFPEMCAVFPPCNANNDVKVKFGIIIKVKACNDEIEHLRERSSELKAKVKSSHIHNFHMRAPTLRVHTLSNFVLYPSIQQKVRKAFEQEKKERELIAEVEKDIMNLEGQLALKLQKLGRSAK